MPLTHRNLRRLMQDLDTRKGRWKLTGSHEISYRETGARKSAALKGTLVAAEPGALVIAVSTREDAERSVTGTVKLSGRWELDNKNRINFYVRRELQKPDKLVFQGAWEVNRNHEVVYTYRTREVLRGRGKNRKLTRASEGKLVFKGRWEITEKNYLTYLLEGKDDSAFRVRGTFETQSIRAKAGAIRYRAGIEYRTSRGAEKRVLRTITLLGKWKLSRALALFFEIEYARGRRSQITVGADLAPSEAGWQSPMLPEKISVRLKSLSGKSLGIELVLTKDFFSGDVQTFLRFVRSLEASSLEAGLAVAW